MSLQAPLSGTVERGGTNVSTSTPESMYNEVSRRQTSILLVPQYTYYSNPIQ